MDLPYVMEADYYCPYCSLHYHSEYASGCTITYTDICPECGCVTFKCGSMCKYKSERGNK
jgi:hypothetical protein